LPELPSLPFAFGNQEEVDDSRAAAGEPNPIVRSENGDNRLEVKRLRLLRPNPQRAARESEEGRAPEVASPGVPDIRSCSPTTLRAAPVVAGTGNHAITLPVDNDVGGTNGRPSRSHPPRLVGDTRFSRSVSERSDPWRQPPRPSRMVSVVLLLASRDHRPGQL
jgi:hypothetical protein